MTKESGATPGWQISGLDFPTFRMSLLSRVMDRATIRHLSESFGLSYAQWRVVARLGEAPDGATVGQLAEQAWVDRAEVSRAASTLEGRGLLQRKENGQDKRAPLLALSEQGWALYRRVVKDRADFHRKLIEHLDSGELQAFERVIEKLRQALAAASSEDASHEPR